MQIFQALYISTKALHTWTLLPSRASVSGDHEERSHMQSEKRRARQGRPENDIYTNAL